MILFFFLSFTFTFTFTFIMGFSFCSLPMADNNSNSFDCSETDLLCNEDTKSLCFFNGDSIKEQSFENNGDSQMFVDFPCQLSDECICWILEREKEHLPKDDYFSRLKSGEFDASLREEALNWMFKACDYYTFNELTLYTAVSYFDRFLSVYERLLRDETWAIQLVAVACLSLATKIEEVHVPFAVDLQAGGPKYLFEAKTLQRMELMVLKGLNWNMKAYTPYNFIDYYLRQLNDGELPLGTLITTSVQIITSTTKGIDFLEYRPSEIGAAVAMFAFSGEMQTMDNDKALSRFKGVEKGRVVKCLELVENMAIINGSSSSSSSARASVLSSAPDSPNGGGSDASCLCLSNKSDEETFGPSPSSSNGSPEAKRRKVN